MKTCYENNIMKIEYLNTKSPVQPNDTIKVIIWNEDGSINEMMVQDYTLERWEEIIKVFEKVEKKC